MAPESIIRVLCETGAQIYKILPSLFEDITNAEARLVTASLVFVAPVAAMES